MSGVTQGQKFEAFRALHAAAQAFVIPNPWDVGSAVLLEQMGFAALATTSAGFAYTLAKPDGELTREQMLAHLAALAGATSLPLSVDLENGFGDAPEVVAATIGMAAQAGAVGGSIEDATGHAEAPIYPLAQAVERMHAAVEAARAAEHGFLLTARCENFLHGRPDLEDTIQRLQAYEAAGAQVLYAPGVPEAMLAEVLRAVSRPVNVLAGAGSRVAVLSAMGVRRISLGSGLARSAIGGLLRAVEEIREQGSFGFAAEAPPCAELNGRFAQR